MNKGYILSWWPRRESRGGDEAEAEAEGAEVGGGVGVGSPRQESGRGREVGKGREPAMGTAGAAARRGRRERRRRWQGWQAARRARKSRHTGWWMAPGRVRRSVVEASRGGFCGRSLF